MANSHGLLAAAQSKRQFDTLKEIIEEELNMSGGLGVASTNYGSLLGTTTTNGTTANGFVIDQYYDYQRDQHVTQMWQQQRVSREQQEMEKFIRENASKPGPVPPVHDDLAWLDKRVDEMRVKL